MHVQVTPPTYRPVLVCMHRTVSPLLAVTKRSIALRRDHLRAAEERAVADQEAAKRRFREWVRTRVPDAEHMNICSGPQIRQLLFPGVPNAKPDKGTLELQRTFKVGCCHFRPFDARTCRSACDLADLVFLADLAFKLHGSSKGPPWLGADPLCCHHC